MEPDDIIHQAVRLKIMAALNALSDGEALEFVGLKNILAATDGNLGAHLTTLENAGYVKIAKEFVGKKPHTSISISRQGRKAFLRHVEFLREIIDGGAA